MAGGQDDTERTEDPTPKRLDDAIERGDVAKSQEVNTWFVLSAGALVLLLFGASAANGLAVAFRGVLGHAHDIPTDGGGLLRFAAWMSLQTLLAVGLPLLVLLLGGLAGNAIQHRLLWTTEPLKPKLSKISPLSGLKRLFGKEALVNFLKGLVKLAIVAGVLGAILVPERERLVLVLAADMPALLAVSQMLALKVFGGVVAVMAFVAALDYLYQRLSWYNRQRMTVREVRDEFKQTDGDPQIKARIRQIRQSRMKQRMMAQVPKASVVITNPTHFAVALRYEPGMAAPVCLAKGADSLAFKIREVAEANRVPIVENPPLARALHATTEIDKEIRPEHYKAVAEVIGYVMRLKRGRTS